MFVMLMTFVIPTAGMCLEKKTFYRLISGFHTSINVDVTANWIVPREFQSLYCLGARTVSMQFEKIFIRILRLEDEYCIYE